MRIRSSFSFVLLVAFCLALPASAQSTGPDVIVGDIQQIANYRIIGTTDAFSIGTVSCNIGDQNLQWIASTPAHPVIAQNLYRLHEGRFTQLGQSWLKHGFSTIAGTLCDPCGGPSFSILAPGCSDPYSAGLNGSQSGLGPKFEVNASTGVFPYPFSSPMGSTGNSIFKRLRFDLSDVQPGARYFVEAHYVTADDAAAGNNNNNASWREIGFATSGPSDGFAAFLIGYTRRTEPAIYAWREDDPSVCIRNVDIPNDGRLIIGYGSEDLGGGLTRHNYSIKNLNSDRSVQAVNVSMPSSASVSSIEFDDVEYHSGEPYDGTDWVGAHVANQVSWATTPHATDPNANALRWGTLYNFSFVSDTSPGPVTLDLFKPGTPTSVTTNPSPPFAIDLPQGAPEQVFADRTVNVTVNTPPLSGAVDPTSGLLFASVNGATYVSTALTQLGGTQFAATLPVLSCYDRLEWYLEFQDGAGSETLRWPKRGAEAPQVTTTKLAVIFEDDFENNLAWTVFNDASLTGGAWQRGVPADVGRQGDPRFDSDGSGQCYLTENVAGNSDVDGGGTELWSPIFDCRTFPSVQITCDIWFDNDIHPGTPGIPANPDDQFEIDVSDDGGTTWTNVITYAESNDRWNHQSFLVDDFVALTDQVRVRFRVADQLTATQLEAGVDNFKVQVCPLLEEDCAAGTVNDTISDPVDVLLVNGSSGGPLRRVVAGFGTPITFQILQPPANVQAADWAIIGTAGIPDPSQRYDLGFGIGEFCFTPCPANPSDPNLFMLANNIAPSIACPALFPATLAPWTLVYPPGIAGPIQFTLQALVRDASDPLSLSISNAVIYRTDINF